MIGKTLSHYEICSKLGEGGMGTVYRAHDNSLGRDVALKVLSANLTADIEFNQRFEREVKSLAALRHPSIVTIHSFEKDAGVCFYTMELVEGRTLADQIPATGFPLDRLFQLIIPVIDAVSHAHTQGIIHRDLKPTNIMLDQDGTPKVLDFGLAKLGDAGPTTDAKTVHLDELQTAEGRILGTFAYMSPEQAEGKPTDHRSDIFSLGIILYEMATGQRPFTGDTPVSTISAIIKDAPTSITTLNQHLPRHLWRIVKKCLEKDPGRRYQSTRDLRNDLAELKHEIDSGELSAPPPTMTSGGTRWARTGPWVALAIVIVIAAILGYQALKRNGPPAEAGPVQLAGAVNLTRSGKVQAADLTPDGKFLVYSERVKDRSNLRVLQLSTSSDVEILPPGNDKISSVQIGPQGDHAYYLNDTRRAVYRIALLGGDPQLVSEDVDEYALAPDGRQLAIMRSAGAQVGLWLGDIERGQQEPLLDEMQIGFSAHLTWSYAGDCILFNALKEQSIAQVLMQLSIAERLVSPANTHVWGYVDALSRLRDGSGFMIAGPRNPGPATIQEPSELWLMPTLASEAIRLTYDPFDYAAIGSDGQGNRLTTLQKQFEQTVQVIALANPAQPRQVMHMSRAGRWWMPLTWTRDDRILYPAGRG